MKNCLIVLGVLIGCFAIAVYLVLFRVQAQGPADVRASGRPYMIAMWRDYDDPGLQGVEVTVGNTQVLVDVPATPQYRRITEKGRWSGHTFYCDSHLDAPPEIAVARELGNEDLQVDIGYFLPGQTGTVTLVKDERILDDDERPPYPLYDPHKPVAYPPPKGLIHPGMLQCDLDVLAWHSDRVDIQSGSAVVVNTTILSDGSPNKNYFPAYAQPQDQNPPEIYTYHSDRPGLPPLLVTVVHGRVTSVTGGAEDTDDPPYQLPPPPASP